MSDQDFDQSLFPSSDDAQEFENMWNEGVEEASRARPTGTFQAKIVSAQLCRSSSGKMQIAYKLEVTSGESIGVELNKYDGLGSPKQVAMSHGTLKTLGIDAKQVRPKELPAHLLELADTMVQCQGRVNGAFYNIYINRVVDGTGGDNSIF